MFASSRAPDDPLPPVAVGTRVKWVGVTPWPRVDEAVKEPLHGLFVFVSFSVDRLLSRCFRGAALCL